MPESPMWIVSITERYGELETVTHHPVLAIDWNEAMEAGRGICAYEMRGDWVQREDENMWSYLGYEQAARVTDAVQVRSLEDAARVLGFTGRQPVRTLPPIGRPYDLADSDVPVYWS